MTNLRPMQAAVWTTACLQLILSDEMTIFAWIFAGALFDNFLFCIAHDRDKLFNCIAGAVATQCKNPTD